jgi:polyribonucleotide nucleotidyltransferase
MSLERKTIKVKVDDKEITFETGKIGRQANGSVLVQLGETIVFATACAASEAQAGTDFLPLRVDYQESLSSAGKTSSGFIKRQGRPSEKEIMGCRLIDRPLRPMFEDGYFNEVQILSYVWSYDTMNSPEPLAICAASAALVLSDIPLIKPVAGVRVGLINNKFVINPTIEEMKTSKLDLMMAGTDDAVLMIEGFCDFLTEDQVLEAIHAGHEAIKTICEALLKWQGEIGKPKNRSTLRPLPSDLLEQVSVVANPLLASALRIKEKLKREDAVNEVKLAVHASLFPEGHEPRYMEHEVNAAFKQVQSKYMRRMILEENLRADNRHCKEIRSIDVEQGILPRTHGSSLFTRGETQAMAICTLGGESMAQRYEDLEGEGSRHFYLQYSFPPYSVGEVGRIGAPGRREIGHGKLAERSLQAVLPGRDKFPYIIRLESNITESNGSSSMASVCGGCLALMDAGVPILRPVAGIAMGLILEGDRYAILSDILGIEDALGDMDFKVAGDQRGITAFQMDIKVEGITPAIMRAALEQAKEGRVHILKIMLEVCPKYKDKLSDYAPRIETMTIKPSKIAIVIGPGGKQIRSIIEETGVEININDEGIVNITSQSLEGIEKAKAIIMGLTAEAEIGKIYTGKVTSIVPFGIFVEILPGKEGLCHISEFDNMRIANLSDYVKQGDCVSVKVLNINDRGQLVLSRKATLTHTAPV